MACWEVEERDGIVVAAHNNPPMNYLVAEGTAELAALVEDWQRPEVRVVVITGAPKNQYITHYSVEELVRLADDPTRLRQLARGLVFGYHTLLRSLAYLDKPVIAAMNGDTMGAGLELSLNCDIRIAQRGDFRIGFPEVALGILTGTGSQLLARMIGSGRALDFLLRSRTVAPEGALELGIVNELADDARSRAREIAEGLKRLSPVSVTAAKRSIVRGANLPIEEGLQIEGEEWLKTIVTDEAMRLMRDYVAQPFEKRREWIHTHGVPPAPGRATGA
jgi:enoyl-CoA hydratase/carnithine racemase